MMREVRILPVLCVFMVMCAGCAGVGRYLENRLNDFTDCFTARGGWALGLGTRLRLTHYLSCSLGGYYCSRKAGYVGRKAVIQEEGCCLGLPLTQLLAPFIPLVLTVPQGAPMSQSGVAFFFSTLFATDFRSADAQIWLLGLNLNTLSSSVQFKPPPPPKSLYIEFGLTLGIVSFDVGFNPAEAIDFLLGLFGLDIMGDDG